MNRIGRFNFGNQITNGMQILSIGATTAARTLGAENKKLNNRGLTSDEDRQRYMDMQAGQMQERLSAYENKTDNPFRRLSDEDKNKFVEKKAQGMRDFANSKDEDDIDDILEGITSSVPTDIDDNGTDIPPTSDNTTSEPQISPQYNDIQHKMFNDMEYIERVTNVYRDVKTGRFIKNPTQNIDNKEE